MDGVQMGMDNTGCSIMGRSQIIGHRLAVQGKGPESKRKHPSKTHCHCRTSIPHSRNLVTALLGPSVAKFR